MVLIKSKMGTLENDGAGYERGCPDFGYSRFKRTGRVCPIIEILPVPS
jgi:hypothetical protein